MTPIVSIVMPTRGRPTYVERAVASVLEQSFRDFEVLILDNSSRIEKERIREISKRDSRIVFVDRGNIGITAARKLGAELSRGKLFALLDSDDYWDRERLERHVEIWTGNRVGLTWDRWAEAHEKRFRVFPQPFSEGLIPPPKVAVRLYKLNFIHASSGIVSTSLARSLGFPFLDIMSSDWTLFMRAAEYYPAYFLGETLSYKEIDSPERVSDTETQEFFLNEILTVKRWSLLNRPRIYGPDYLKRRLGRILRGIKGRSATFREPQPAKV